MARADLRDQLARVTPSQSFDANGSYLDAITAPRVRQLGPEHAPRPGILGEQVLLQLQDPVDVPPAHLAQLCGHLGVTTL